MQQTVNVLVHNQLMDLTKQALLIRHQSQSEKLAHLITIQRKNTLGKAT
jgi:hypothetical protein